MKRIITYMFTLLTCLIYTSCSTSTRFSVITQPGTEILTPQRELVAVADESGKASLQMSDDSYYAFLLSHTPGSEDYVPFALDYKKKKYVADRIQLTAGYYLTGAGLFSELVGLIAMIGGDDEIAAPFFVAGSGATLLGVSLGMPANARLNQVNHEYRYRYLSHQRSNLDIPVTTPVIDTVKVQTRNSAVSRRAAVSVADTKQEGSSASGKRLSQAAAKTLKDYGALVAGTYKGTGQLTQNGSVIERYKNIEIVIRRIDKEMVSVNVIEDNGEKFFLEDSRYKVEKLTNGNYQLTMEGIPSAKIIIEKSNRINYVHPRVNIDGDMYLLKINGEKQ